MGRPRLHARRAAAVLLVGGLLQLAGCSDESRESRAREAAAQITQAIADVQGRALAQDASSAEIALAQRGLAALGEYQGEVNGRLDAVTVNAIQAFQRAHGLRDDGILDADTRRLLAQAARPR